MSLFDDILVANGFTKSEPLFEMILYQKKSSFIKALSGQVLQSTTLNLILFPLAERLLIKLIIQRRIQNRVKYLKWSFLWK